MGSHKESNARFACTQANFESNTSRDKIEESSVNGFSLTRLKMRHFGKCFPAVLAILYTIKM